MLLSPPSNENNSLNPEAINQEGLLKGDIRDISSVSNSFGIYKKYFSEGFDYAILESARKLNSNEFKLCFDSYSNHFI